MNTRDAVREFRELVERLVSECNRGVALKAAGDWKAFRAHERGLGQAVAPLRDALVILQGSSRNGHEGSSRNGHDQGVEPGLLPADVNAQAAPGAPTNDCAPLLVFDVLREPEKIEAEIHRERGEIL